MHTVAAFVPEIFLNSGLPDWFDRKAAERGADIEWLNVNKDMPRYKQAFKDFKNVITWQCRMPHSWTSSQGVNVLHLDNSLIAQKKGCFVDARGFFSESNLRHSCSQSDVNCEQVIRDWMGWESFSGGDPDGPVLVALQYRRDCNVNFEYPLAPRGDDKVRFTLDVVKKHLPEGLYVWVRPHPRERELFAERETLPDNWVWSMDGTLAEVLPKCSALVTVNSTCATEACALGLPVAVLGTGAFTGSGAVIECHQDFTKLQDILGFKPDKNAQKAYVSKVLTHHTLPYDCPADLQNVEVDLWLDRLQ